MCPVELGNIVSKGAMMLPVDGSTMPGGKAASRHNVVRWDGVTATCPEVKKKSVVPVKLENSVSQPVIDKLV